MLATDTIEKPIIHHLLLITKKYLSCFADFTHDIELERYHYVLLYIYQNKESLTQKDLADYFKVDKSFVVNMIDYLSKNDLVYRQTADEDRRKHFIKLTEKAHQFIPKINDAFIKTNQLALDGINESDKETFLAVIKQLEINLNISSEHIVTLNFLKSKI
nr:MarR family transcriptional regulator [uncultured Pedobacter sp.]